MEPVEFDRLVARIVAASNRRDAVKGVLTGAIASAGIPMLGEAKTRKGKGQANAEGTGKKRKSQVSAAGKKPFCLCPGSSAANCTATTCVNCVSQGEIGKNKRKKLKQANPFSFVGECPVATTTTTTTTARPTTTTTTRPPVTTTTTTTSTTTSTTTTLPPCIADGPCVAGQVCCSDLSRPCDGTFFCFA